MSTLFSYLCLLISKTFHNSCFELKKKFFLDFCWGYWDSKKRQNWKILWFFHETLTVKESCYLTRKEVHPRSNNLQIYLPSMIISTQKKRIKKNMIFSKESKNPKVWLDDRHTWLHPIKSSSLRCYLPLMANSMHNNQLINWFFRKYWL